MDSPLFGTITDLHLSPPTLEGVGVAFMEAVDMCVQKEVSQLFLMGDIFTNRKALEFETLQKFHSLLNYAKKKKVMIIMFPGNHDKISYLSEKSYLDVFQFHPGVQLITTPESIKMGNWDIACLPFFDERNALPKYLQEVDKMSGPKSILLTHIAIDGVKNNDGSEVSGILNRKIFKDFFKVFVGHYHDKQKLGDSIFYIGSLTQNNHGENDLKGITFFNDDGTHFQEQLSFKKYVTVDIDLSKFKQEEISQLLDIYSDSDENVRFKFEGDKDQLKKIKKNKFTSVGISVSYKESIEEDVSDIPEEPYEVEFGGLNKTQIIEGWDKFCETREEYLENKDEGKKMLEAI